MERVGIAVVYAVVFLTVTVEMTTCEMWVIGLTIDALFINCHLCATLHESIQA
jgi:hypothetical protein